MLRTLRVFIIIFLLAGTCLLPGCGKPQGRGVITGPAVQAPIVEEKLDRQQPVTPKNALDSQILFGDLHVHTTFSPDAFVMSLPLMGGSGLRSPADACDFARYCSSLDFWSINDHAEGITPRRWAETKRSIRECNEVAGDPTNPDTVAFLGWEWSQVSTDPTKHYGHKNVFFLDTQEDRVPLRPIASPREQLAKAPMGRVVQFMMSLLDFDNRGFYWGIQQYYDEVADTPICPGGVDTRDLPANCLEIAELPSDLFAKLDEWDYESIVIPHGTAWGMNTPASTALDIQLNRSQHDPDRQILFEIYSGHGNSEEYRSWRGAAMDESGGLYCPEPSDNYLPCCARAGQIIRQRCEAAGISALECEQRELQAQRDFVDAGNSGHLTVPGQQVTDWLDCGTCPDCFNEPMDHRPTGTAQYALAITDFSESDQPFNFRFGLIGSSDNHRSMAGSGYKQVNRKLMTETFGAPVERNIMKQAGGDQRAPVPYSVPLDLEGVGLVNLRNMERQNSFWLTGGLVATHSNGRDRGAIWNSLKQREVYATSGDRILLWFDLLAGDSVVPMGSQLALSANPRFRVRAVGDFKQMPGCPDYATKALGEQRLETLCGMECYNPSDERQRIDRIEVVRIRPQIKANEAVEDLVEDPWRTFTCEGDPTGCQVEFEDEDFLTSGREAVYYVRAVQEASAMINADNVRCDYDDNGVCVAVDPCHGDYRTPATDDCLAPVGQRAWSSPIFVAPGASIVASSDEEKP
jgi:hypothetical protein